MDKRKLSTPTKICRYNSMCFRLNPLHFDEFRHPHLEAIIEKGISSITGEYDIPDDCQKDKVIDQLEILKSKLGNIRQPPEKMAKNSKSPDFAISKKTTNVVSIEPPKNQHQNSSSSQCVPSTSSSLQNKLDSTDYFKERAAIFKSKDSEEMKATTPTIGVKIDQNDERLEAAIRQYLPVVLPKGQMADKLKKASPYNMFLTTVSAAPETHSEALSVTFQELLDPSLGELECSVQFNFMVDIGWLLAQYIFAKCSSQPLLILYGEEEQTLRDINKKRSNVTSIKVNIPTPIGVHHTKMMLLFYKDKSMRVVVSTANLYEDDWNNRTQGLWISERLPALDEDVSYTSHGESVTKFREDLTRYLVCYNIPKLQPFIAKIRKTDFSSVNVFFVSSVPGTHRDSGKGIHFGHLRLASLLSEYSAPVDDSNPIILQASSIGSLGTSVAAYLGGEIASSFKRDSAPIGLRRVPKVKFIYPSLTNVLMSHDGIAGGGCLPYDGRTHAKQLWLNEHLYQWRASTRNRNHAMPHIKTYCRFSERGLYWFVLTSANVSRSAWGVLNKSNKTLNPSLRINSFEAGVVFFPRIILKKDRFPIHEMQQKDEDPIFKLPYDIPLVSYAKDDVPYCAEYLKDYLAKYGS
ncbi:CLUMA_CG020207, isoform A [Clunio marinus]|uniref:CLUMA_CG020207, isoform A n=1 Tax=Clunio marinus TaxID=568069 RepID=A0A1J1J5J5_9DIPT|nr:CLUMA_CG020207, isoform A [Clunio marinus]